MTYDLKTSKYFILYYYLIFTYNIQKNLSYADNRNLQCTKNIIRDFLNLCYGSFSQ